MAPMGAIVRSGSPYIAAFLTWPGGWPKRFENAREKTVGSEYPNKSTMLAIGAFELRIPKRSARKRAFGH